MLLGWYDWSKFISNFIGSFWNTVSISKQLYKMVSPHLPSIHQNMIRRYIAVTLIVLFFSYASYLIITDGGKPNTTITFTKLNENINKKFSILTGKLKPELTPDELAKIEELKKIKAAQEAAQALASGVISTPTVTVTVTDSWKIK